MKVIISKIKKTSTIDAIYLCESDFHPCKPFFQDHNSLLPESYNDIRIKGVLESTKIIRPILSTTDSLLAVDGILRIDILNLSFDSLSSPYRNRAMIMNEISLTFKSRISLIEIIEENSVFHLVFKKTKPKLPENDTIYRWSFGIVSDGRKNDRVKNLIEQIAHFNIIEYEIIICGPSPYKNVPEHIRVLDDKELYSDIRIPISKKKNLIIDNAIYNNVIILHDRFSFSNNWYSKLKDYGNYFDGICIKILDEESKSNRVQDWLKLSWNPYEFKKVFPMRYLLAYDEWTPSWNINGGLIIIKKHLIEPIKLNPFLNWGEMEDIDMCKRLNLDGFCLAFYSEVEIFTETKRLKVRQTKSRFFTFINRIKYTTYLVLCHLKRVNRYKKYISNID